MNEVAGNQDVMHYHVHVLPRYEHDWFYDEVLVRAVERLADTNPKREELERMAKASRGTRV